MSNDVSFPLVSVVMGSQSDWEIMANTVDIFEQMNVAHEVRIISAHRTPHRLYEYATQVEKHGIQVIIAGAGGSAHLPGMIASMTALPVLAVPITSKFLTGLDSLMSIVQMPAGIPVGCLAVGKAGAKNAALMAVSILGLKNASFLQALKDWRQKQTDNVAEEPRR